MITYQIHGFGTLDIEHLVLDVNGTIVAGGQLLPGVADAVLALRERLHVVAVTADTRGTAHELREALGIDVHVIPAGSESQSKLDYLHELGADQSVAVGNGANDDLLLRAAAVGIAVMGPEGVSARSLLAADVVVGSIGDALALVADPQRMVATLRR